MSEVQRYFRCKSNPNAPLLVLNADWEANEMRTNLEYDEVDEDGLPVVVKEQPQEEQSIPFKAEYTKKR